MNALVRQAFKRKDKREKKETTVTATTAANSIRREEERFSFCLLAVNVFTLRTEQ